MAISEIEHPLYHICEEWLNKIEIAKKVKWEVFGQYAQEATKFYQGTHDWMWREEYAAGKNGFLDKEGGSHLPTFRMTVNKPFEAVALFGPALFHKYPEVTVTAKTPPIMGPEILGTMPEDPMYQEYLMREEMGKRVKGSCAEIKQYYLNWLQTESQKKEQARRCISEAIVKGLGLLWTELHEHAGAITHPKSRFISCDDLLKDPDATYEEDVQWIARRTVGPINLVARKFNLREQDLRGHMQSYASQSTREGRRDEKAKKSKKAGSYDLIEYWEIWSKNGMGHRLRKTKTEQKSKVNMDWLGDNTYIVVAKGIPFPLNFPSYALAEEQEQQFMRAQWPIPFWTDEGCGNGWPYSDLHFYERLNCVWPQSMIKPAIGELRFVNWCMSFLADKVASSSTTYVAVVKQAGMEIQDQLQRGLAPYTTLEISDITGKSIHDVVSFLEAPQFSLDIWKMVSEVMGMIDKRTGLTELIYGLTGTQMRSATEADVKNQNISIRPDDMAERTEDWYSQSMMKEMEAMVWGLNAESVAPIIGQTGAAVFEQQIQGQQFESVVRDYTYRVVAGSARKPNKNTRLRSLNEWGQVAAPVLQMFAEQGMVDPWNAYVAEVAKAMDLEVDQFLVQLPPPEAQPDVPSEDEMKQVEHEAEIERDDEKHDQEIEHKQEMHRLDMMIKQAQARATASSGGNGK